MMFLLTDSWRQAYPGAAVGFLVMNNVANPPGHPELEKCRQVLEQRLRQQYSGLDRAALNALAPLQAYTAYYKRFKKTYHVALQLESLIFKDRSLPSGSALVEAMFQAELENMLLTAGHDLDSMQLPLRVDSSQGNEQYRLLRGEEQVLKPGDMFMADQLGIISSIVYGPDQRTRLNPDTRRALFAVYAPSGIPTGDVAHHLRSIRENIRIVAPQAEEESLVVFSA